MNYTKISIAGDLGSGKSTIAQKLTKKFGCRLYSTGDIQREIAKNLEMSTLELNKHMEKNSKIDEEIDEFNKNLNIKSESFIIDSRMAWHFIPTSFKIFLKVDPDISARRVLNDNNRKSESYTDFQIAKKELAHRKRSENERFLDLYSVDCSDMNNYDLVVDTSYSDPESIVDKILMLHKRWSENDEFIKFWANPKLLFPTQPIAKLGRSSSKKVYDSIQFNGFKPEFPIEALNYQDFHFIFDGHLRVSASIFSNISLIPLNYIFGNDRGKIIGVPTPEFVKSEFKISYAYDWEECHKFTYPSYPTL
jgi:predicted cytidylate kinase